MTTPPNPYDYASRSGLLPISWQTFHSLCKGLARAVAPFQPELVLAVGRGGYYPGTLVAHLLRLELYPVRLSRRVNDVVRYRSPRWLVRPPALVRDRRVLVVDEIASTGETLRLVTDELRHLDAREVRSAVLYAHTGGADVPDYIGLLSDALILNPWDREVFQDGQFVFHPEYVDALRDQGLAPLPDLLPDAEVADIAKRP